MNMKRSDSHSTWIAFGLSAVAVAMVGLGGCGSSSNSTSGTGGSGGGGSGGTTAAALPPMGATALEAWLATGTYKSWTCEPSVHDARSPSPHGFNRICSNSVISTNATSTADWPIDAAAVKELYASAAGTTPIGYAVYLKTNAASAAGANWYWYERTAVGAPAVADGMGDSGVAMSLCVGCHMAAGTDAAHTPSVGGHDEVYTPVH
jgi:hypothetical protein